MKKASSEIRKEQVMQHDFGSHVRKCFKRCQQVNGAKAWHVHQLVQVLANVRVFTF